MESFDGVKNLASILIMAANENKIICRDRGQAARQRQELRLNINIPHAIDSLLETPPAPTRQRLRERGRMESHPRKGGEARCGQRTAFANTRIGTKSSLPIEALRRFKPQGPKRIASAIAAGSLNRHLSAAADLQFVPIALRIARLREHLWHCCCSCRPLNNKL
jgi:hypothetical protein